MTDSSAPNNILSRGSSFTEAGNEAPNNNFDDYIRDVPIELFTVSKMVVTTNTLPKNNTQEDRTE
ncbi:hypothetical protein NQ314_004486 [Rhamnusium bicolor]|uniref:Uncharacterized protein n=1 Tax=Rhamnusium bicolor TaxID=1586634 RepID=A0AAV8ZKE3_9CUCU|nr:hypothetical protein NQ314_004486 [Rhamnusium bicolor]